MENDINLPSMQIKTSGIVSIDFVDYEKVFETVEKLTTAMKDVEVTEENIKETKRLLARVRKELERVEDERKEVKKRVLEPYNELESKVKTIRNMVEDADSTVRKQVRELEELQRQERWEYIQDLYNSYETSYQPVASWYNWELFLDKTPRNISNKSTSKSTVRETILDWFNQYKADMEKIHQLNLSMEEENLVIFNYKHSLDIDESIERFVEYKAEAERIAQEQAQIKENESELEIVLEPVEEEPEPPEMVEVTFTVPSKLRTKVEKVVKNLLTSWA